MALFARKVKSYDLFSSHAWYYPGVSGMFALLGFFLLGTVLGGIVMLIMGRFMSPQALNDYGMIVVYPLQFLPAMIYAASKSQRNALFDPGYKLSSNHFGTLGAFGAACLTFVMTAATMMVADAANWANFKITTLSPLLKEMYDAVVEMMNSMTGGPLWSSFLVTAIFAPIFEEWLCRGMVLRGLLAGGKMKPGWAIVVSALFFALIHMNPWQALNAFILGLLMGYIYYRTGNLWLTMFIHFINNGSAVILSQIDALKDCDFWMDIIGMPWYWVVFAVCAVVVALGLRLLGKIPVENRWGNLDKVDSPV